MTSAVSLYRLKSHSEFGKMRLACKLVEMAFKRGHKVYVATVDESHSEELDRLLWTYSWSSFVPHSIQSNDPIILEKYPVILGHEAPVDGLKDVLVSTLENVPDFAARFDRILDPVDSGRRDAELALVRERRYHELTGVKPVTYNV